MRTPRITLILVTFVMVATFAATIHTAEAGSYTGGGAPIPDNSCPTTVNLTLPVSENTTITTVTVSAATTIGMDDLVFWLQSPQGTQVQVHAGDPSALNDSDFTVSSAAFAGENALGTWTLLVCDGWGGVVGTVDSWTLAITGTGALSVPVFPPAVFWPGHPDSPAYDGRINAEPADRYVVYCANSELQVWDGKNNIKMGTITFADISAMPDPGNQQIGDTVFLGRSNNILTVNIGPGAWIKDNIKLDKCVAGEYKGK